MLAGGAAAGVAVAVVGPAAAAVLVVVLVGIVVCIYLPGVLLAAYLLIAVYKGAVQPYSAVDITLILALLNFLQIVPVLIERRLPSVSRAAIVLWVALAALVLFGVLYAPDQGLAMSRAANFSALVLLPLPPAAVRVGSHPAFVRQFLWTFFGVGALVVALGLARLAASERLTVLEADTIDTARVALLVPLLGVAFVWREGSRLVRGIAIILIPTAIVVAVASGSRGPVLMLLVLIVVATVRAVVMPRSADWRVMSSVAGVALASAFVLSVAAPVLPASSTGRIGSIGQALESGLTSGTFVLGDETRLRLYRLAVTLFEEQPVIGAGTAGYYALSPRYLGPLGQAEYPHNALLQFAAEYGLIGLALFVGIVLLALVRRQAPSSMWSALKWLFVFMLLNAMVSGNILEERTLWGLLLLLLVAPDVQRIREATPSPMTPFRDVHNLTGVRQVAALEADTGPPDRSPAPRSGRVRQAGVE